jgi:hypothetical protein
MQKYTLLAALTSTTNPFGLLAFLEARDDVVDGRVRLFYGTVSGNDGRCLLLRSSMDL